MAQEKARPARARKKKDEIEVSEPVAATVAKVVRRSRKQVEQPAPETVAFYAYLLWERGEPGDATEHWLRAERELIAA